MIPRHVGRRRKQQRLECVVVEIVEQRPRQTSSSGALEILTDRALAQPQALADCPLRQLMTKSEPQNFSYFPHRHSLTRHFGPLLPGKGSRLPSVENCQQKRSNAAVTTMIMITGTGDQDPLECMITIHRIR